ncbi:MAG: hypothetical protein RL217_487 [Pseudomonadota bacterium]|jgi:outer membrane protein
MRVLSALVLGLLTQFAVAGTGKVAVVDMERALFMSDAAKTSIKDFEKANKADVDKLKALQAELLKMKEKAEKEGDVMSEEERRKLTSSHEEKASEFKFYAQKIQQLEGKWKQEFLQTQLPVLEKELKALIDAGGYDVVMQAGAVVYTNPESDLTKALIERLNASVKAKADKPSKK